MAVADVLKNFRGSEYGDKPPEKKEEGTEAESSPRTIQLSGDEVKSLGQAQPGQELTLQVTGKLEDDHFHIMSVQGQGAGQDVNADAEAVMAKMRGPMQGQTIPSPS